MNSSLHVCEIQRLQQYLFDHIFLLRGDYLLTKNSLTLPQFIKVIYVYQFDYLIGTVLKVWCILKKDKQYIGHEKRT